MDRVRPLTALVLALAVIAPSATAQQPSSFRVVVVAPIGSEGDLAIAGAEAAASMLSTGSVSGASIPQLDVVRADDSNPYDYGRAYSDAVISGTALPTAASLVVTSEVEAAESAAATAYRMGHAMVAVNAYGLDLNVGTASALRMSPSAEDLAKATAASLREFNFQRLAVLASSDAEDSGIVAAFKKQLALMHDEAVVEKTHVFKTNENGTLSHEEEKELEKSFDEMHHLSARVVVLFSTPGEASGLLAEAKHHGILDRGWTWAGALWMGRTGLDSPFSPDLMTNLEGSLCVLPTFASAEASIALFNSSTRPEVTGPAASATAPFAYDSLVSLAIAAGAAGLQSSDPQLGASILATLKSATTARTGLTGSILFDNDDDEDVGSRIGATYAVTNVDAAGNLRTVLTIDSDAATVTRVGPEIVWTGDRTGNPPADRVATHIGAQAWFIVLSIVLIGLGILLTSEFERRGYGALQITLITLTLGLVGGLLLRAGQNSQLKELVVLDETVFTLVLLPIIIFESGFCMEMKALFFRNLGSILLFAIVGTTLTTFFIGGFLSLASQSFGYPFTTAECFAVGALLSAVDPVATLGIFGSLKVEPRLNMLVYGEAVVNDAVAIVLYRAFTRFMAQDAYTADSTVLALLLSIGNLLGAACLGFVTMMLCSLLLKHLFIGEGRKTRAFTETSAQSDPAGELEASQNDHEPHRQSAVLQATVLLLFSYVAFAITEGCHLSGIVASLSAGLTGSLYCAKNMTVQGYRLSKQNVKVLAQASELFIFLQVGANMAIFFQADAKTQGVEALALVLCLSSRAIIQPAMVGIANIRRVRANRISVGETFVMWNAGLRGAIAWALAIGFPSQNRDRVITVASAVILLTTYVQGGTTGAVLKCVGVPTGKTYDKSEQGMDAVTREKSIRYSKLPRWMRSITGFNDTVLMPLFTHRLKRRAPVGFGSKDTQLLNSTGSAKQSTTSTNDSTNPVVQVHEISVDA